MIHRFRWSHIGWQRKRAIRKWWIASNVDGMNSVFAMHDDERTHWAHTHTHVYLRTWRDQQHFPKCCCICSGAAECVPMAQIPARHSTVGVILDEIPIEYHSRERASLVSKQSAIFYCIFMAFSSERFPSLSKYSTECLWNPVDSNRLDDLSTTPPKHTPIACWMRSNKHPSASSDELSKGDCYCCCSASHQHPIFSFVFLTSIEREMMFDL